MRTNRLSFDLIDKNLVLCSLNIQKGALCVKKNLLQHIVSRDEATPGKKGTPGKGKKIFVVAVLTLHPGKAIVQVAAFKISLTHKARLRILPPQNKDALIDERVKGMKRFSNHAPAWGSPGLGSALLFDGRSGD